MKRRNWILAALVIILIIALAVFVCLWRRQAIKEIKLEILCENSVYSALEHFEEYNTNGNDSDYIAGVAEFHTYMRAYLVLTGESDTNYIWCNALYGDMTLHPEKVKAHITILIEALEYLEKDYDHPNGFNLINTLNNELREKE